MTRFADDPFLIAYERSGRCRVSARAAGLGLAAGMLAELALGGHVDVRDGRLLPAAAECASAEGMLRELLASLDLCRHDSEAS